MAYASSCIDISDGLVADLGHICESSGVAASLNIDTLPISAGLRGYAGQQALTYALNGGDDYELCFTVAAQQAQELERSFQQQGLQCSPIGQVIDGAGVHCVDAKGNTRTMLRSGYEHFGK